VSVHILFLSQYCPISILGNVAGFLEPFSDLMATKFGVAVSILLVQWCSNELQPGVAQRRHDRFTQTKMSECSYLLADEGYIGLETMEEDDHLL